MKQSKNVLGREAGSLVISFAIALPIFLLMVFGSIDIAHMVLVKRELQKIADMSAIAAAEGAGGSGIQELALNSAQQNGMRADTQLVATQGYWATSLPGPKHFTSTPSPDQADNAVEVQVSRPVPYMIFLPPATLHATAIAWQPNTAGIGIDSTLLNLDSQKSALLNAILGGLLGAKLNLSAASYQGLADTNISLGQLAEQLNVGNVNSLLTSNLSLPALYQGTLNVLGNASAGGLLHGYAAYGALQSLATAIPYNPATIELGKIINLGLTGPASAADAQVNLLGLITASAMLSNEQHFVDIPNINLLGIASLGLTVISPPQLAYGLPGKDAAGNWRTVAKTAQVALQVQVLGSLLNVTLQASPAEAHLKQVVCALPPDKPQVTVGAGTAILSGTVGLLADPAFTSVPVQNFTDVDFNGYPSQQQQIDSGSQSVNLTLDLLGLKAKLGNILSPIIDALEPVLGILGISLGTANVQYASVGCGTAQLVY
jgi:uncharacterized membrane protein